MKITSECTIFVYIKLLSLGFFIKQKATFSLCIFCVGFVTELECDTWDPSKIRK